VPLKIENNLIGVLLLGRSSQGDHFDSQELESAVRPLEPGAISSARSLYERCTNAASWRPIS
jgi:hypothetical protein